MKYYLLRGSDETGGKTFTMMRVPASAIEGFLKRHAGQVVFEGTSAADVLAQLGRVLDGKGIGSGLAVNE